MKKLTHEEEVKLTRELGELQGLYSLTDESEENKNRGKRIREIREMLGLIQKTPTGWMRRNCKTVNWD